MYKLTWITSAVYTPIHARPTLIYSEQGHKEYITYNIILFLTVAQQPNYSYDLAVKDSMHWYIFLADKHIQHVHQYFLNITETDHTAGRSIYQYTDIHIYI